MICKGEQSLHDLKISSESMFEIELSSTLNVILFKIK